MKSCCQTFLRTLWLRVSPPVPFLRIERMAPKSRHLSRTMGTISTRFMKPSTRMLCRAGTSTATSSRSARTVGTLKRIGLGLEEAINKAKEKSVQRSNKKVNLEDAGKVEYELANDEEESDLEEKQGPWKPKTVRALGRLQRHWRPEASGSNGSVSVLEEKSVQPRTWATYKRMVLDFLDFADEKKYQLLRAEDVDQALVDKLTEMFFEGYDHGVGVYLVVGWQAIFPRYGRAGDLFLPRSLRALKGWRRLGPPRSRVGVLFFVIAGIAALLIRAGHMDMAIWTLMTHGAYLRPVSCMQLRKRCLVAPLAGASPHWCLLLSSSEFNLTSKIGTSDDSVVWDVKDLLWMDVIFKQMKVGDPTEKLWDFNYADLCKQIRLCALQLGVVFSRRTSSGIQGPAGTG